jgi:FKBP-type peptidyl-prolyl cis-trans isomerase FklB|tara:strand:+ start:2269 stop:2991 length:723 start_codon:yes stop_codon:yes gene_type:complete
MKRLLLTTAVLPLAACSVLTTEQHPLQTDLQRRSYAVGYQISEQTLSQIEGLDQEAALKGIRDSMRPEAAQEPFTRTEIDALVAEYHQELMDKHAEEQQRIAAENAAAGEEYRSENAQRSGVTTTKSGMQYEILRSGSGQTHPDTSDQVTVHYHGTLLDGTVFDSTRERGEPSTFPVKAAITGFREALLMMREGDKWRVTLRPKLAYGTRARNKIPPNSTLILDIELLGITETSAAEPEK